MGGKGGGGGAGPMLEYGTKALDLQKQIYGENKELIQPYYQAGTSGLNELMMRLGLGGGSATNKTAAQLRTEMAPAYTTQGSTGSMRPLSSTRNGGFLDERYDDGIRVVTNPEKQKNYIDLNTGGALTGDKLSKFLFAQGQPTSSIDTAGLDSAVSQAMAEQQAASAAAQSNPLYGSLLKNFGMDSYQADPGYQFRLSEGNKALERALASRGQFSSMNPAAAKALQDYGQQSASQEYGAAYDRYNMDQGNIFNRLAAITGIGQNATGQLAGVGTNYANAGTDLYTGMGNAITASNQARAANKGSMFNTLLGAGVGLAAAPATGGGSLFGSLFR